MYKITVQDRANGAAETWKIQRSKLDSRNLEFTILIYNKLIALGETPNPDDIDEIIGNSSWTRLQCGQCNKYVDTIMSSTEKYNEVDGSVRICLKCLEEK